MKPTNEHIEEQILLMLDGELNEADTAILMGSIAQDPELGALLDAYRAVYLEADSSSFPDKESLLRREPEAIPFLRSGKGIGWAAAAVLFIITGVVGMLLFHPESKVSTPASHLAQVPGTKTAPAITSPGNKQDHAPETAAIPVKEKKMPEEEAKRREPIAAKAAAVQRTAAPEAIAALPTMDKGPAIDAALQPEPAAMLAVASLPAPRAIAAAEPEAPAATWGPFKEESLQGINDLLERFKSIKKDVQETARVLKDATFVIQLGNKEIALGK